MGSHWREAKGSPPVNSPPPRAWASRFAPAPPLVPQAVGVGLGTRRLDRPNLLRLWLAPSAPGAPAATREPLLLQQAQVDDATPEDVAFLMEELRSAGAVEVFSQPIQMKKGRTGLLLSALASPERSEALRSIWWTHGTSLGVREQLQVRWRLHRSEATVETSWGPVRIKEAFAPDGGRSLKPEYEDLAALARRHGLSLQQVRQAVLRAWQAQQAEEQP
jgi:pyridinium-3,5-bisthiocarboxylic acid mononucleotide nickel chelatase